VKTFRGKVVRHSLT